MDQTQYDNFMKAARERLVHGPSRRDYFIAAALSGMLANPKWDGYSRDEIIVQNAIDMADMTIRMSVQS